MEETKFTIYSEEKSQDYGRFCIEPLARGYGDTLGNALRRLLLSSIRGAAVTAVKIDGVLHEFSTIKGIREDVIEILMNLKHIPIRAKTDNSEVNVNEDGFKIITLDSDELPSDFFTREENPGVITAHDMPWDNDFEFCGDGVLCTLEPDAHLIMEIYVEQGVGYLSAERERPSQPPLPIDAMLADAIFSPVKRVNYQIENARVGQSINFERLILEVWTNGAVLPEEAVKEAATLARDYFGRIADTVNSAPQKPKQPDDTGHEQIDDPGDTGEGEPEIFTHPIHELELSIRSENCLLRGGIQVIGDLVHKSRDDLLKIRNLGRKSLNEIEERLKTFGFALMPSPPAPPEGAEEFDEAEPESVEAAAAQEPEPEPQPEAESAAPEPEAEPEPEAKPVRTRRTRKTKTEDKAESETETPAPVDEAKPKRTRKAKTEAKAEPEVEAKPKRTRKAKPKAKAESESGQADE